MKAKVKTHPPKPKEPEQIKEQIHAKYTCTEKERLALAISLGEVSTEINKLENEKSAVSKDFASRIETKEIDRTCLVDKVTLGYEMRPTDCIVTMDPKNRTKDYFAITPEGKAGDFVERREMTATDFQLHFPSVV